jgi:hypothetical protein
MGYIFLVEVPLVLIGCYVLIRNHRRDIAVVLLVWLFGAIVPAAVTRDVPHAMRIAGMMPILQIIIALGLIYITGKMAVKNWSRFGLSILIFLYTLNFTYFIHQYFVHYPIDSSGDWRFGRKEAALYADLIKNNYDKVLVSTNLEYPHVFFLYYLRYDPVTYLNGGGTISGGWGEVNNKFDKYEFRPFDFNKLSKQNYLFVGKPEEFPQNTTVLTKIYNLDDSEAIWIVEGERDSY